MRLCIEAIAKSHSDLNVQQVLGGGSSGLSEKIEEAINASRTPIVVAVIVAEVTRRERVIICSVRGPKLPRVSYVSTHFGMLPLGVLLYIMSARRAVGTLLVSAAARATITADGHFRSSLAFLLPPFTMILRTPLSVSSLALLLSSVVTLVLAQDNEKPFDCYVNVGELKYDLHSIGGEHIVSRERESPPTKYKDAVRFNLCEDLKQQDGVASEDQVSCFSSL